MNTAGTGKLDAGTEITFNSDFSAAGSFLECRFLIYKGKKKKKAGPFSRRDKVFSWHLRPGKLSICT